MPIELNGKYWTLTEISEATGKAYITVSRKLVRRPGVISVGPMQLVPDEIAQALIKSEKEYVSIRAAGARCRISPTHMGMIVAAGFPVYDNMDGNSQIRINDLDILQSAYFAVLKKNGWNKSKGPAMVVEKAKEMMAARDAEQEKATPTGEQK